MCPFGFKQLGVHPAPHAMVCHVLLIETEQSGLVLVDTGLGRDDLARPRETLGAQFVAVAGPTLDARETAYAQIRALDLDPNDVRHIVPTHMDLDHAGGLPDFPGATVHIFRPELEAVRARATLRERERYRPAHLAHGPRFRAYDVQGERWHGFECVRDLDGLPPEILLIPTTGHTRGHVAVAVDDGNGFLVHAGDAYFHRDEMRPDAPSCPLPLRTFQRLVAMDDVARVRNQERLRLLRRDHPELRLFSAHDPVELARFRD